MPEAGVFGFVANVALTAVRSLPVESKALVYRICPLFCEAVPVWQFWQVGSWNHPWRVEAPTVLMRPWQSWHWIMKEASAATAFPIAPRRQRVTEPGWQV